MIYEKSIEAQFKKMGARVKIGSISTSRMSTPVRVDIRKEKGIEYFKVDVDNRVVEEILVPDCDAKDRHLLLLTRTKPIRLMTTVRESNPDGTFVVDGELKIDGRVAVYNDDTQIAEGKVVKVNTIKVGTRSTQSTSTCVVVMKTPGKNIKRGMFAAELELHKKAEIAKYLCGHDERHWFVAAVPESAGAKNIKDAKRALKPKGVVEAEVRAGVKGAKADKHKTKGWIRQGEWFFIPAPEFSIKNNEVIHKDEPIRRGAGSPHICQELIRKGGVSVKVHPSIAPNGITESEFNKLSKNQRDLPGWRVMTRDASVYVRGAIKHRDHKTRILAFWHKVIMNEEQKAKAMRFVAFLD